MGELMTHRPASEGDYQTVAVRGEMLCRGLGLIFLQLAPLGRHLAALYFGQAVGYCLAGGTLAAESIINMWNSCLSHREPSH